VSFQRGIDGNGDPYRPQPVAGEHELRMGRTGQLGVGPYCWHAAPVREFLSLEAPSRPARVVVTVTDRAKSLQR